MPTTPKAPHLVGPVGIQGPPVAQVSPWTAAQLAAAMASLSSKKDEACWDVLFYPPLKYFFWAYDNVMTVFNKIFMAAFVGVVIASFFTIMAYLIMHYKLIMLMVAGMAILGLCTLLGGLIIFMIRDATGNSNSYYM